MATGEQRGSHPPTPFCTSFGTLGELSRQNSRANGLPQRFQLDVCDAKNSFSSLVPQRAGHFPVLLYAILAHASLHRDRLRGRDEDASSVYQNRCLQIMIPLLDNGGVSLDENFLAAVVILRSCEEMSGKSIYNGT